MIETGQRQNSTNRSIAAIMFTDMVGFTALMGESEERALRARRINREIHLQQIEEVGGTWLKEIGDGTMASFVSITDALRAAIKIRQACKMELGIELKVGIHFGEVSNEDSDVFGDGVNIASRIESLAAGGGILISESVFRDVKNKTEFKTAFVGETTLKNVAGRHKIYQVLDGDLVKPTIKIKTRRKWGIPVGMGALIIALTIASYFGLSPKPFSRTGAQTSIAVLPFHNLSEDEDQKHYGIGLANEIRSKLSQSRHFEFISSMQATMAMDYSDSPAKIGDELEVKYLLSGVYQMSGERIKLDVELIDTQTGGVVWNLSFNELFADIFELQSKVAAKVFDEFSVADNQMDDFPTQNMEAYSHYLKGLDLKARNFNLRQGSPEAEEQLSLAIQKDSSFIDPYVSLVEIKSYWIATNQRLKGEMEYENVVKEVLDLEDYGEAHFSDSPKFTLIRGIIAYLVNRNYDDGQKYFKEVLTRDPENLNANNWIAAIYKRRLMQKEAINRFSKSIKLDPSQGEIWLEMTIVFASMGDYASAEKAYHNGVILGRPPEIDAGIFYEQGKTYPGQREKDPFTYYFDTKWFERDFRGALDILDTAKRVDPVAIAMMKAEIFHVLGMRDSVRRYGQYLLGHTNGLGHLTSAIVGSRENALRILDESTSSVDRSDKMIYCRVMVSRIITLSVLGEYEEATKLLLTLNREYPNFGRYAALFSDPLMDRIKSKSPSFVKALNGLKLPPKLNLEGLPKF